MDCPIPLSTFLFFLLFLFPFFSFHLFRALSSSSLFFSLSLTFLIFFVMPSSLFHTVIFVSLKYILRSYDFFVLTKKFNFT